MRLRKEVGSSKDLAVAKEERGHTLIGKLFIEGSVETDDVRKELKPLWKPYKFRGDPCTRQKYFPFQVQYKRKNGSSA